MRHILTAFVYLFILLTFPVYAETVKQRKSISPNGEMAMVAKSSKLSVQVKIITHEVQIGEPSDKRPDVIRLSCTYSRYPCSIVDSIIITVNGKPIIVPRSLFCDLADLNTAEIQIEESESILTLNGGDASESYLVKIDFDERQVKRKRLYSKMSPNEPLQETTYHIVTLGN